MRHSRRRDRGITLLEILIALGVIAVALVGLLSVIFYVTRLNQGNRENMIALRAAERIIETMHSTGFTDIFRFYNGNPTDDVPDFPVGGAPGERFEVEMLPGDGVAPPVPTLRALPPNPTCGRVFFPGNGSNLFENTPEAAFPDAGMPRDLDGNGSIDTDPVDGTYILLPVRVEVSWQGLQGPRTLVYHHLFVRRN